MTEISFPLKIGARGSPLSLAQTKWLRGELAKALNIAAGDVETMLPVIPIVTQGDKIQDRALLEAGGKGLFTKELDEALLDGRIDCAIHSMKDVPTYLPDGIVLLGCPPREDRRDALITRDGISLAQLPQGAKLGTASLRRSAQFLRVRPDLQIGLLRGNVGTRIAKVMNGEFDATILAMAGLKRLGLLDSTPHQPIDPSLMPPAIAQGALAITARAGDTKIANAFAKITCEQTTKEVTIERAFLLGLDGSCRTAIAAYCRLENDEILFNGEELSDDAQYQYTCASRIQHGVDNHAATEFGHKMAEKIKQSKKDLGH